MARGSRFPSPTPISPIGAISLEPVDRIEAASQDLADALSEIQGRCLALATAAGRLQAEIAAERERSKLSPLLTLREVADLLKTTPDNVRRLTKAGRLRSTKLGTTSPRYREADVSQFITAGMV